MTLSEIPLQTKLFIQSLRGAQPTIILAFLVVRRAMTIDELEEITGLHNDTIRHALQGLRGKGLEVQRGERGRQTWLLQGETLFGLVPMIYDQLKSGASQNPKFSDSGSTTATTIGREKDHSESVVVEAGQSPKFSDSGKLDGYEILKAREAMQANQDRRKHEVQEALEEYGIPVKENLKMCQLYGIGEPMASKISEDPQVTPDFIEDHIKSLGPGESKGLAIVRIRGHEMPRLWVEEMDELFGGPEKLSLAEWHKFKEARKLGLSLDEYDQLLEEVEDDD